MVMSTQKFGYLQQRHLPVLEELGITCLSVEEDFINNQGTIAPDGRLYYPFLYRWKKQSRYYTVRINPIITHNRIDNFPSSSYVYGYDHHAMDLLFIKEVKDTNERENSA